MGKDFFDRGGDSATGKPETKGFKRTTSRLRQGKEKRLSHRASLDWRLDQRTACDYPQAAQSVFPLEDLQALLLKSRTAEALLSLWSPGALSFVYDAQTPMSQFYPKDGQPVIALNPHHPKGDLVNFMSREVRRAWQFRQGALVNPLSFDPDEAILINRAQQADALMISIKIAWELKLAGEPEAWNYLTGSPMADVTRMFEIRAQGDFRSLNNGEAARAAYDKFFEDSRTKSHDKRIIHMMLLDEAGYIRDKKARPKVSLDLFRKLGELPHGKNYLLLRSQKTPTDMCYATIEDRSNANFLWFIKFERSFQEKEMQMIEQSVKLSAEIVDFAKWSLKSKPAGTETGGH